MSGRLKGILRELQTTHGADRLEVLVAAVLEIATILDRLDGDIQAVEETKAGG